MCGFEWAKRSGQGGPIYTDNWKTEQTYTRTIFNNTEY